MLPIRECVRIAKGYVPGEQPQTSDYIKLNTNENPYPPPPEVFEAVQAELAKIQLYSDPICTKLRIAAAQVFGVAPEQIVVGNGSDDVLNVALRTFVNPRDTIAVLDPTYSLYKTLARVNDIRVISMSTDEQLRMTEPLICPAAKLIFLASPNPPLGQHLPVAYLAQTCARASGVVVIDEAYVDFSDHNAIALLEEYGHVVITRTMSKSYSLAGARVGFGLASREILEQMNKVRDVYNLNRISQAMAVAALEQHDYFQSIWQTIRRTRDRLTVALRELEFTVFDSEANFVLAAPQWIAAEQLYERLKGQKILIRHFQQSNVKDYVRISIGTDVEIDRLLGIIAQLKSQH